ncbi:MAG: class E sortase [Candidatus Komeilibacteria bacterium]
MPRKTLIRVILLAAFVASFGYLSWTSVRIYSQSLPTAETADQATSTDTDQPLQGTNIAQAATAKSEVAANQINTLQVAAMKVDSRIWEGAGTATLNKGLWRIPGSSTPDKGGNTVIAAHRWKWLPTSKKSFYDIDKVKVGDQISLQWAGKDYQYKVSKISTVTPDKVDILKNSDQPKLTLFSCTPLFSSKYRLIVEADLITT